MKNCDEMVSSLLRRRDEYEHIQRMRRQTARRITMLACSLALVLFISTGVDQGWWVAAEPELPTVTPAQAVTELTESDYHVVVATAPTYPPVTESVEMNYIVINEIDNISGARMYIALMVDDFVPMDEAELQDYFGMDIFPEVPEDLGEEWSKQNGTQFGIYRRDGGTGEVYHDQQVLNWSNGDFTRCINIELCKGRMPFQCFGVMTEENENSVIGGVEMFIGRTDDGIYLVEFMYRDVGFRMIAEGLTQDELTAVIRSLLD